MAVQANTKSDTGMSTLCLTRVPSDSNFRGRSLYKCLNKFINIYIPETRQKLNTLRQQMRELEQRQTKDQTDKDQTDKTIESDESEESNDNDMSLNNAGSNWGSLKRELRRAINDEKKNLICLKVEVNRLKSMIDKVCDESDKKDRLMQKVESVSSGSSLSSSSGSDDGDAVQKNEKHECALLKHYGRQGGVKGIRGCRFLYSREVSMYKRGVLPGNPKNVPFFDWTTGKPKVESEKYQ